MSSIDTLTIDEFDMLQPEDHAVAIQQYSQRITQIGRWLRPGLNNDGNTEEVLQDELRRCQNLRKIHVHKLHEQLWQDPAEVVAEQADGSTAVAA